MASGLVSTSQLDYCLRVARYRQQQQGAAADADVTDDLLAEVLIEQKLLTQYQTNQLREGRTKLNLGPYICTDWIGQGGMGQVFKAVHEVMGRECAVKVLPQARATKESLDSFAHEIRMQAKLDCPYLVRAFDAGQDGKVHYLVTEYVPGMDLRRLVKSRGPLPVQQCAQIIMQAALGLEYAHEAGLVHRDVKPGNILVTPEGDAKVSDVGLAGFAKDLINDPRAGKIVGTTDYLSPEQIRTPLEIQPTSDIYSLGCTLYYALCGKVPFPGGDTESKLRRHLYEYPLHPRNFVPDITEEFADIIVDMTDKDPRKRISTAAEVASRLQPWASDSVQIGAVSMAPTPWMAPPPPQHESLDRVSNGDVPNGEDTQASAASVSPVGSAADIDTSSSAASQPTQLSAGPAASFSGSQEGAPPLDFSGDHSTTLSEQSTASASADRSTTSVAVIVALTVAIVVPPALLVGAILGFLARGNM